MQPSGKVEHDLVSLMHELPEVDCTWLDCRRMEIVGIDVIVSWLASNIARLLTPETRVVRKGISPTLAVAVFSCGCGLDHAGEPGRALTSFLACRSRS